MLHMIVWLFVRGAHDDIDMMEDSDTCARSRPRARYSLHPNRIWFDGQCAREFVAKESETKRTI